MVFIGEKRGVRALESGSEQNDERQFRRRTFQVNSNNNILHARFSLLNALHFITKSCNLCHGNVTLSSVYVTPLGEFKLFDYYITTPIDPNHGPNSTFRTNENLVDDSYRSPERKNSNLQGIIRQGGGGIDAFSLSVLIRKLYSDPKAGTGRNVPKELHSVLAKMQGTKNEKF